MGFKFRNTIILNFKSDDVKLIYESIKYYINFNNMMIEHPEIFSVNEETAKDLERLRKISGVISSKLFK